jgi:tetratricopeptide (TPR) repeat protein
MANRGDEYVAAQKFEEAKGAYGQATELAPGNVELEFWKAVSLYKVGEKEEALLLFREVFDADSNWARVVPRLAGLELLADDPEGFASAVEEILAVAPESAKRAGLEEWERRR